MVGSGAAKSAEGGGDEGMPTMVFSTTSPPPGFERGLGGLPKGRGNEERMMMGSGASMVTESSEGGGGAGRLTRLPSNPSLRSKFSEKTTMADVSVTEARISIRWPHFRQRIRTLRPETCSSAIWYFALQLSQRNFIAGLAQKEATTKHLLKEVQANAL